ncbi:MAG: M13-type metalloendopeptidase [Clostridia bacterium]
MKRMLMVFLALLMTVLPSMTLAQGATPATDFWAYANQEVLAAHPEQEGLSWSAKDAYTSKLTALHEKLLKQCVDNDPAIVKGTAQARVASLLQQFFAVRGGKDESAFVLGLLAQIESCASMEELLALSQTLSLQYGLKTFLTFITNPDENNLPCLALDCFLLSKGAYLCAGDVAEKDRELYRTRLEALLTSVGMAQEQAQALSALSVQTEFALCDELCLEPLDASQEDAYIPLSMEEFQKLFPAMDMKAYMDGYGVTVDARGIYLTNTKLMQRYGAYLAEENLASLKAMLQCSVVNECAHYLTPEQQQIANAIGSCALFQRSDEEIQKLLSPMEGNYLKSERISLGLDAPAAKPDADDITTFLSQSVSEEVTQMFVDEVYDKELFEKVDVLFEEVRAAFAARMQNNTWLSQEAKTVALAKIENIQLLKMAGNYYSPCVIKDSFIETMLATHAEACAYALRSIAQPILARQRFLFPTYIDNAQLVPTTNSIAAQAGLLLHLKEDPSDATLYGVVGITLAHELSHAFDPGGVRFDEMGAMKPWMNEQDKAHYDALVAEVINCYRRLEYRPGKTMQIDEKSSRESECIADRVAGCILMDMLKDKPALQREALEAYAHNHCVVQTEAVDDYWLEHGDHPIYRVRVNALCSLLDNFYELYDVPEGSPMYTAPKERGYIW